MKLNRFVKFLLHLLKHFSRSLIGTTTASFFLERCHVIKALSFHAPLHSRDQEDVVLLIAGSAQVLGGRSSNLFMVSSQD
jgi:hypothetical protein